jgi:hypothetical protein
MNNASRSDREYHVEYYEGFYSFRNEKLEVLMDEATFDKYMQAYLVSQEIETRTYSQLVEYAAKVSRQHFEAEQALHNPDYWAQVCDPHIRIIQRKNIYQPVQTDETNATSKKE